MSIAATVGEWAKKLETSTGIKTIRVTDESATWVMTPKSGGFVCEHDGELESDTTTVFYLRNGEMDDYERDITICVNCKEIIEES